MKPAACVASVMFLAIVMTTGIAQASTLNGSTVTATLYNPNLATILGGPLTKIVAVSSPTFPVGSILGNTAFQIDISGSQIMYKPLFTGTYGSGGTFNGFVFVFSNAPTIVGVTLDPTSTFIPTAIGFTANSISLDLRGNAVTQNSFALLDLQLQPTATPEPATWALMACAVGGLWFGRRRRRQREAL